MSVLHHFDQPGSWQLASGGLIVRGWCFAENGPAVTGVRVRTGGLIVNGVTGLPRPDVRAALPNAPGEDTGFEISCVLPGGRRTLQFEAGLADGTWQELRRVETQVPRRLLPRWLGGGNVPELMASQTVTHHAHPPRPLPPPRFEQPPAGIALPWLSIVTPSYQQARFVRETMESVVTQPGVRGEYVVQDGGSTDGSRDIIERVAADHAARPSPISVHWESARDDGQADAIARGFAKTTGRPDDLMAWINSDDFFRPGALAHVAGYFAQHPDIDAVYAHRILVDENSQEIGRWYLPRHDAEVVRINDFVPQETLFWRRRLWDRVGGLDRTFQFAMDWDLLLRFQEGGARIVRLPCFPACFRVHVAQKTSAAIHHTGQAEIDRLRTRAQGRVIAPAELENDPRLLRYLRRSALLEAWSRLGLGPR